MRKESDVKRRVKELLDKRGIWWMMHVPTGMGKSGIPDFLCCLRGRFVAIETKFGDNRTTALQDHQLELIESAGGHVVVINERNLDFLADWLDALIEKHG